MLRLGHIDYLNTLPVYFDLLRRRAAGESLSDLGVELVSGVPSQLNAALVAGELDVSAASSIEYARHAGELLILPGLAVAADGPVGSIFLFSKRAPWELDGRPVALTTASATSVVLLKILCDRLWQVRPRFFSAAPELDAMLRQADAALLIGDDALAAVTGRQPRHMAPSRPLGDALAAVTAGAAGLWVTDLGGAWKELTGLPMVYALWTVRRDTAERQPKAVARLHDQFLHSLDQARRVPEAVIEWAAARSRFEPSTLRRYFSQIRNDWTPELQRGLQAFYRTAAEAGELPGEPELCFFNHRPPGLISEES